MGIPRQSQRNRVPTPDELKTWPTSKLLACFAMTVESKFSDISALRTAYANEIDRRFPVPR